MASGNPEDITGPIYSQPLPLLTRSKHFIKAWVFKAIVAAGLPLLRFIQRSKFKKIAPSYSKRYPIRPMLECRVFLPQHYVPGRRYPLYLDIHGGGFVIGDPAMDDHFCHHLADKFGYLVVSLDYRKAPVVRYPVPVDDAAELARAVLADEDLPIDPDKVVLGGFSAGGNLSLAIAQFDDLRTRIRAVVPIYPSVDMTATYRSFKVTADGKQDLLRTSMGMFKWAYVPPNVDMRSPQLSPLFAKPEKLPNKMYFVGAEYDCLCDEANVMAKRLAGLTGGPESERDWAHDGIRWEMVRDRQHGFTHMELRGEKEVERLRVCEALYQRIDDWIRKDVFGKDVFAEVP